MSMRFSARVPVSAGMCWCVVGVVVVTVSLAYGGTPVSYSTTVVDPEGAQYQVQFAGQVDNGMISGRVVVDGNGLMVAGTIGVDGSVVGSVMTPEGTALGTFRGK